MLLFLALMTYSCISAGVLHNRIEDVASADQAIEGRPLSDLHVIGAIMWVMITSFMWPLYYAGRALYTIPERLALPPGEGM